LAWREFSKNKRSNKGAANFELNLEDHLFKLHNELITNEFRLHPYKVCIIQDPKRRVIHIASIRDRVLFHAIYRKLYHVFDPSFIYDVYSSRTQKGTHAGINRLEVFLRKASKNYSQPTFVLKCDIRKFFDSVDHRILIDLISKHITDGRLLNLIKEIIESFNHTPEKGIPLGNVTSQLFANIYMNIFDQFIKHKLKIKYYIRYCDDFVIINNRELDLKSIIPKISCFLQNELKLDLHPQKTEIRKIAIGGDFLGYVLFPYYRILRTSTKNRMFRKMTDVRFQYEQGSINEGKFTNTISSYLGMLKHCKGEKISSQIERIFWD
jgi:retron-type reverse transcriptase